MKSDSVGFNHMKVAIVTDWMVSYGGADRVTESILKLIPSADVYTSVFNPSSYSNIRNVRTTFLQNIPWVLKIYRHLSFLTPFAFEALDLTRYDLILSLSAGASKGIITTIGQKHLAIIFTPPRAIWDTEISKRGTKAGFIYKAISPAWKIFYRAWDITTTKRIDKFLTISKFIHDKALQVYGIESSILYPPLSDFWFEKENFASHKFRDLPKDFFLTVSRLYEYKRIDWIIKACIANNKNLIVVGSGPDAKYLHSLATGHSNIVFFEDLNDKEVRYLYNKAEAFIFAGIEDFGLVVAEATACGCPTITIDYGGASEICEDDSCGLKFADYDGLLESIQNFDKTMYNKIEISRAAEKFREKKFLSYLEQEIKNLYA